MCFMCNVQNKKYLAFMYIMSSLQEFKYILSLSLSLSLSYIHTRFGHCWSYAPSPDKTTKSH